MMLDEQIFLALNSAVGMSPILDSTIYFFAEYLPFLMAGMLAFLLYRSKRDRFDQLHVFCVAIFAGILARVSVEMIRVFIHRPRPYLTLGIETLLPLQSWSFPSGHAAFLFGLAGAAYAYDKRWGIGFFVAAAIVSIARVASGAHYPSDVLAGAVCGVVAAFIVIRAASLMERK